MTPNLPRFSKDINDCHLKLKNSEDNFFLLVYLCLSEWSWKEILVELSQWLCWQKRQEFAVLVGKDSFIKRDLFCYFILFSFATFSFRITKTERSCRCVKLRFLADRSNFSTLTVVFGGCRYSGWSWWFCSFFGSKRLLSDLSLSSAIQVGVTACEWVPV